MKASRDGTSPKWHTLPVDAVMSRLPSAPEGVNDVSERV
jgi:hypothetical protein